MPEIKPTRVFSRDQPCSKVDLWNAFATSAGLKAITVVESRGEIGLNAPKYLLKQGFLERTEIKGVEYYSWTGEGEAWLRKGLLRHLELHPDDEKNVRFRNVVTGPVPKRRIMRKAA